LHNEFRNEFVGLSGTQWGIYDSITDPDADQTKKKFADGLELLRESGLNLGVLLTLPDETKGKYSRESLATFELSSELRGVASSAPGVYLQGRTLIGLPEAVEIAGWIPDFVMYGRPR
jgi:hypothetical protein